MGEKKKTSCGVAIVIILMLMVLGLGGYIAYDKIICKDSEETEISTDEPEEESLVEYEVVPSTADGEDDIYSLKVNGELLTYNDGIYNVDTFSKIDVYPISDVLVVSAILDNLDYEKVFVVDGTAKVVSVFSSTKTGGYSINVIKSDVRPSVSIKDNSVYINTDELSQDNEYTSCTFFKKDKNYIVVQTEKFDYLGNGKFSPAELVDSVTAEKYIADNNIDCSKFN